MSTFTVPEEFAEVQIYAGGRTYAFVDGVLELDDEADARRVRAFAEETPHIGIFELPELDEDPEPGDEPGDDEPQDQPAADAPEMGEGDTAATEADDDGAEPEES